MQRKHQSTLKAIFERPERADISWKKAEKMLAALGAEISQGRGSRVRVKLGKSRAVFHEPHPGNEMDKGAVKSLRKFLMNSGVVSDKGEVL